MNSAIVRLLMNIRRFQSIELSHLDDVAEPLKLSEELNRVLSQYGIRSVRFVVSDQRIVQQTLTYPDHQQSLVTDIPWVEDCSFGDLEDARKACHQVILQKSLERLNKKFWNPMDILLMIQRYEALHES